MVRRPVDDDREPAVTSSFLKPCACRKKAPHKRPSECWPTHAARLKSAGAPKGRPKRPRVQSELLPLTGRIFAPLKPDETLALVTEERWRAATELASGFAREPLREPAKAATWECLRCGGVSHPEWRKTLVFHDCTGVPEQGELQLCAFCAGTIRKCLELGTTLVPIVQPPPTLKLVSHAEPQEPRYLPGEEP